MRRKPILVVLMALALAAGACASESGETETTIDGGSSETTIQAGEFNGEGVLQPLESGFPNQPITILVVDDPGSDDSIYASQLQVQLQKRSPVRINVEHRGDFSNFGTWEALAWVIDQEGGMEGYIPLI